MVSCGLACPGGGGFWVRVQGVGWGLGGSGSRARGGGLLGDHTIWGGGGGGSNTEHGTIYIYIIMCSILYIDIPIYTYLYI